jgi:hypothetical protein
LRFVPHAACGDRPGYPREPAPKEYSMDAAVPILPGDIIKVPQRYF